MTSLKILSALLVVVPLFTLSAHAGAGQALQQFFGGIAGATAWLGQVSFNQLDEQGVMTSTATSIQTSIHSHGPNDWSVGGLLCLDTTCYSVGDEIEWKNGALAVHRYDGNTMPAQVTEATADALAYSFVDPYGGTPTRTTVREEIRGDRFIRQTMIELDGKIYEEYVFSVTRGR